MHCRTKDTLLSLAGSLCLLACSSVSNEPEWVNYDRAKLAELIGADRAHVQEAYDAVPARVGRAGRGARSRGGQVIFLPVEGGGTRVYEVSDLLHGVRDFPGPILGDLRHPDDRPSRDEDVRERVPFVSEAVLIDLVENSVYAGEDVTAEIVNGKLIVRRN